MAYATATKKLKGVTCVVGYRGLDVETNKVVKGRMEVTRTLKGQGIKHVFGVCMMGVAVGKFLCVCSLCSFRACGVFYAYWERRQQSKGDEGHP